MRSRTPVRKPPPPVPQFSAACYFMTANEKLGVDDNLRITSNNTIISYNPQTHVKAEFGYNHLYTTAQDFARSSYNTSVSGLVRQALVGESTMMIIGGPSAKNINNYLLSQTNMQGLLSQAASQLLFAVNQDDKQIASITFSWYKIDCQHPEIIIDILKSASTQPPGSGAQKALPSEQTGLMLREGGKGRGMVVPGLWEIELANGQDIEAIVSQVLKNIPGVANPGHGTAHTIMMLHVRPKESASSNNSMASNTPDSDGGGRISFVVLSPLHHPIQPSQQSHNHLSIHSMYPNIPTVTYYPWIESMYNICHWLSTKRPSPPFHSSRLLLLLRDILLRKQKATLLLLLAPTKYDSEQNIQWLQIMRSICKEVPPNTTISIPKNIGYALPGDPTTAAANGVRNSQESLTSTGSEKERAGSTKRGTIPSSSSSSNPSSAYSTPTNRLARTKATSRPNTHNTQRNNMSPPSSPNMHGGGEGGEEDEGIGGEEQLRDEGIGIGGVGGGGDLTFDTSPVPRSFLPAQEMNITTAGVATPGQSLVDRLTSGGGLVAPSTLPATNKRPTTVPIAIHNFPGVRNNTTNASSIGDASSYIEDFATHESEAAISVAYQALQQENAALRIAYQYSQQKQSEIQLQYDTLINQLKEEGGMLEKRDKERLRNAMKDLKDYEIYKQVMETAMIRLQNELQIYAAENQDLKQAKVQEERQNQKQKSFSEKYSKDLVATKKRYNDLESKYLQVEKQLKGSVREKEAAVSQVAQMNSTHTNKFNSVQEALAMKTREYDDLARRFKNMEDRMKQLETEKEQIISANTTEVNNIRFAHNKALETLMSYQEENDILRSTVVDLSNKNGSGGGTATSAVINPPPSVANILNKHNSAASTISATTTTSIQPPLPPPMPSIITSATSRAGVSGSMKPSTSSMTVSSTSSINTDNDN